MRHYLVLKKNNQKKKDENRQKKSSRLTKPLFLLHGMNFKTFAEIKHLLLLHDRQRIVTVQ